LIQDLADFSWDDFLLQVQDRTVIPVIGDGILLSDTQTVSQVLAQRLASGLGLQCAEGIGLRGFAGQFLDGRGKYKALYPGLVKAISHPLPEPPAVLQQIGAITDFPLVVTLGVDPLAANAVRAARGVTQVLAFHPRAAPVPDLPKRLKELTAPVVYHLFGKSSPNVDHVITDEDLLEFLNRLHNPTLRPANLFGDLKQHHLLFLGADLPDWAMRILLRLTRDDLLSSRRDYSEYLTGRPEHSRLNVFLNRFSEETTILGATSEAFMAELFARWTARQPGPVGDPHDPLPDPRLSRGKIFISYFSEDRPAVNQISNQLGEIGIETWFDRDRLELGDLYEKRIRNAILNCDYFMPILSVNIMNDEFRFAFKEWAWAIERSYGYANVRPFLLPVAIDNIDPNSEWIHEPIRRAHWGHAIGGTLDDATLNRVKRLVRDLRKPAP